MTNPFLKRVDILTDWHNRFPDANVDLLAELILDVWQQAEADTEQRIIKLLEEQTGCGYEHYETERCFCDAIALIKGENK